MFVAKSKYEELEKQLKKAYEDIDSLDRVKSQASSQLSKKQQEVDKLQEEVEQLQKLVTKADDRNQVTIYISDDMTTIEPVIKFKETANDYLMKIDYVNGSSDHETQIGLMLVAQEGLTQIVESFMEHPRDD